MKTTRRILSMVLALMMILSLSVTAFATSTPRVEVTMNTSDGQVKTFTLDASAGDTMYDVVDDRGTAKWTTVTDYYDSTKTHQALISFEGKGTEPINTASTSAMAKLRSELKKLGYNDETINNISWLTGDYAAYGLISNNGASYTYVYAAYDWTYNSNLKSEIWDYMCCYELSENEIVYLTYDLAVSVFTSQYPIG